MPFLTDTLGLVVSSKLQGSVTWDTLGSCGTVRGSTSSISSVESDAIKLGHLVREQRIVLGWTLENVADEAFSNPDRKGYVSRIENGRIPNITRATVRSIARALHIDREKIPHALRWVEPLEIPRPISPGIGLDRNVIGRDLDVDLLHEELSKAGPNASPATVISGQGGMGKTTLAQFYVQHYSSHYRGVWWLNAQNSQTIAHDLRELAQVRKITDEGVGYEALARAVLVDLQSTVGPWLLIYDNAEDLNGIRRWRPMGGDVRLLVTSRERSWPDKFVIHDVERLRLSDATGLLLQEARRERDRAGAERLAEALDGLPLAIVNAGAWLRDTPGTSFEAYEAQLEARLGDKPTTLDAYPDSVFGAVTLSLEKLSSDAVTLMHVIAYLSPDHVHSDLFINIAGKDREAERYQPIPDGLWSLSDNAANVEIAFAELERRSLLKRKDQAWSVHRLVQLIQRILIQNNEQTWNAAAAVVAASYPGKEPDEITGELVSDRRQWNRCSALNPHIYSLKHLRGVESESIPYEYLLNQSSIHLHYIKSKRLSAVYAIDYLKRKKRRLPQNDVSIGRGYYHLAYRLVSLRKLKWAEQSAAKAVEIAGRNTEITELSRSRWISNHGLCLRYLADKRTGDQKDFLLEKARNTIHEAIAIIRSTRSNRVGILNLTSNNLGLVFESQLRLSSAALMFRVALYHARKLLPKGDIEIAIRTTNLGRVLLKAGKFDEARSHLTEGLSIREDAFADNTKHPVRIANAKWLSTLELLAGHTDQAAEIIKIYAGSIDMSDIEESAAHIARTLNENPMP